MTSPTSPLATQEDLDETIKLVEAEGTECLGIAVDVRDGPAVQRAVAAGLGAFGRIDILLANAGIAVTGPLVQTDDATWQEVLDTNLTGVFHCLRAVVPGMQERGYGRIVITSSMGGRMGIPNLAAYVATKWGVIGLAKSLALEVATQGITVNVVCPCTVDTPMVRNSSMYQLFAPDLEHPVPDEVVERFRRVNPIPQPWISAEDVTRTVVYLVTDPGVISGAVLEVGLGSSARLH